MGIVMKVTPQNAVELSDDLIDINEAAVLLRMRKSTVYAATSNRTIPFFKRGNRVLFRRSELVQWLLDGRRNVIDQQSAAEHEAKLRGAQ